MQIEWCVALRRSGKSTRCTDLEKCDTRCSRNSSEAGPKSYNAPLDSSLVSRTPLHSYEYPNISIFPSLHPIFSLFPQHARNIPSHAYRVIIRLQLRKEKREYRIEISVFIQSKYLLYIQMYFLLPCTRADKREAIHPNLLTFLPRPPPYDYKWRRQNRIENWPKNQSLPTTYRCPFSTYIFLNQNTK